MIKESKIDFKNLGESKEDTIYSKYNGSGAIFCATGGVMEAAVRSAYKFITGRDMKPLELKAVRGAKEGIKLASVDINGKKVNVAVAQGIKNAMNLLSKIKSKEPGFENIHFLEVMACPGGCVMGGGSPKAKGKKGIDQRLMKVYHQEYLRIINNFKLYIMNHLMENLVLIMLMSYFTLIIPIEK